MKSNEAYIKNRFVNIIWLDYNVTNENNKQSCGNDYDPYNFNNFLQLKDIWNGVLSQFDEAYWLNVNFFGLILMH